MTSQLTGGAMTIPSQPGWYWIRDAEIVRGSQWVMCYLDVDPRPKIRLYTPDNNHQVWNLEPCGDGGWYSSLTDGDELATECRPMEWVRIEEPQGLSERQKPGRPWPDREKDNG